MTRHSIAILWSNINIEQRPPASYLTSAPIITQDVVHSWYTHGIHGIQWIYVWPRNKAKSLVCNEKPSYSCIAKSPPKKPYLVAVFDMTSWLQLNNIDGWSREVWMLVPIHHTKSAGGGCTIRSTWSFNYLAISHLRRTLSSQARHNNDIEETPHIFFYSIKLRSFAYAATFVGMDADTLENLWTKRRNILRQSDSSEAFETSFRVPDTIRISLIQHAILSRCRCP